MSKLRWGYYMKSLVGLRFGTREVLRRADPPRTPGGNALWDCRCECGRESSVTGTLLRSGSACPSCKARKNIKHGLCRRDLSTPEWKAWRGAIKRCYDPGNPDYARYGGRGITVCARWRASAAAFLEDMGNKPSPEHTLDRIDNSGDYEPSNCQWATRREQANNTRSNVMISFGGKTMPVSEWARSAGLNYNTLKDRLRRGWSAEDAITSPLRRSTK